ncbi:MAG TPA: dihydroneopterin aldolase [Chitinophagaceae bacterium]|nr:dihydroneopterin aldolase [Chitinophagaceae bacterium]
MSSSLLTIRLNNVRFRAYHGLYPEERQKGNDFVVNLVACYKPAEGLITDLAETIDYAELFSIINATMQEPVDLLETLVQQMAQAVHFRYPQVYQVEISVEKLNPPIDQFEGSASVSLLKTF